MQRDPGKVEELYAACRRRDWSRRLRLLSRKVAGPLVQWWTFQDGPVTRLESFTDNATLLAAPGG